VRTDKRAIQRSDKKAPPRANKRGVVGFSKKSALLEEAITHMNTGKYGRSSAILKELLALDPQNTEARRLFATLHLRLGSLVTARQAFESLANEAIGRQDYWLAESLLREYLAAGPRCVPFLEQLAHVYQEKGDEMAAVGELGKAIEVLRDDPDPDNPQKPAQLYSKIRELAPASSVAFQFASLFDVQTGEFLVRPSVAPSPASEESAVSSEESPRGEQPPAEVMPWEVTDESHAVSSPDPTPQTASVSIDVLAPSVSPPDWEAPSARAEEESSGSMPVTAASVLDTPLSDQSAATAAVSEPQSAVASGLSSPMPWEEMADSSVQIVESQSPTPSTPSLESVLASMRTDEQVELAPAVTAIERAPMMETVEPVAAFPLPEPVTSSSALSGPMPWEQISDAALQVPTSEPALPSEEAPAAQPAMAVPESEPEPEPLYLSLPVSGDPAPIPSATVTELTPQLSNATLPSEPSVAQSDEPTQLASFSWNSVLDKAWRLTAGTIAPGKAEPSEDTPLPQLPEASSSPVKEFAVVESSPDEDFVPPDAPAHGEASVSVAEEEVLPEAPPQPPSEPECAATPVPAENASHWNTGEVAVQVHRPSMKKKRWEKGHEAEPGDTLAPHATEPSAEPISEEMREWRSSAIEAASAVKVPIPAPADLRPEWMQATDAITFDKPAASASAAWSDGQAVEPPHVEAAHSVAASAVEVLFSPREALEEVRPRDESSWSKPRPRLAARMHRIRIGVWLFIGSCFSTTRSLTFLAVTTTVATMLVVAAAAGALGLTWMVMEEPPSPIYQSLTIAPARHITDTKKNGYLLLLGFDAPAGSDPVQTGYERKPEERDRAAARVCTGGEDAQEHRGSTGASGQVTREWVRNGDVLSQIKGQGGAIRSMAAGESTALARYQQWLAMPFDDWGFGQLLSPNCAHVLMAHRLFLLEGFNQDLSTGLDRLEADVQSWRSALGQSKTLTMKMLAMTAVQDDAAVASGLLSRVDLDAAAVARLSRMVRPLDQVELSVRWPMQSQFVWATKTVSAELKEDESRDRPWHASMAASMRLPVQRRANAYAAYYDAANKAVAGGRYTSLPKRSSFVRTPATGLIDYLANPLEHIVGIEPLASWDPYVLRITEADAQLRLAGLQAWIRRGPAEGDILTRLAKAGQAYYDPFTGLPMLVNQRKGIIYSVGLDGKDQEGNPALDVVASIPTVSYETKRSAGYSAPQ
jgi:hypothetical protein